MTTAKEGTNDGVRLVGVGVTAEGWASLVALAAGLRRDGTAGYVVVHRPADGSDDDRVARLRASTPLAVELAADGAAVRADTVYVAPADREVTIADGALRLAPRSGDDAFPIDRFLRSLSAALDGHAVGVVVGIGGDDGVLGLERIKEGGGLTILEDGALRGDLVDLVIPAAEIAARLPALIGARPPESSGEAVEDALRDILTLVRVRSGHDFAGYKRATLLRRIARRMQVCQVDHITEYQRHLRDHPDEAGHLLRDFLISVTNFFRDPDTFEALDRLVLPKLFAHRDHTAQVRIWVAGCASGEEAYSLAMLAAEHAAKHEDAPQIQIFATDIDEDALAEARLGRYPVSAVADLGAARVERFFTREGKHLRVKQELREMVLFSPHNVLRDPPFSKLDLATCRNLLIYLNREAQERVLGILHFGLRPDGYLLLGSSEAVDVASALFAPVDGRHRIYLRRPTSSAIQITTFQPSKWPIASAPPPVPGIDRTTGFGGLHHKVVEHYAPPSVLVNEDLDVVHVSEHAGRFLQLGGGEPTRDLLRLVHPGLRLDLRAAIYVCRQQGRSSESRSVVIELDGKPRVVQITVRALDTPDVARGMVLVTFAEQEGVAAPPPPPIDADVEPVARQLEDELQKTREHLRSTVEQYEISVEELKASNEELHAINEELRSATEELETSKEELQSVNEELTTLNHELKDKIDQVSRANGDLQNLMTSTDIGVLFLDRELHIQRYTPRALDLFNLIPSDVGRPLAHLTHRLERDELVTHATEVLRTLRVFEQKVRTKEGRWYLVRVHPYRSLEERIEGVVLTFLDISEVQAAEDARRGSEAMLRLAERAAGAGGWQLDDRTGQLQMSDEARALLGIGHDAMLGLTDWIDAVGAEDRERVRDAVRRAAERREELDVEFRVRTGDHAVRWLWALGRSEEDGHGLAGLVLDVTARRRDGDR